MLVKQQCCIQTEIFRLYRKMTIQHPRPKGLYLKTSPDPTCVNVCRSDAFFSEPHEFHLHFSTVPWFSQSLLDVPASSTLWPWQRLSVSHVLPAYWLLWHHPVPLMKDSRPKYCICLQISFLYLFSILNFWCHLTECRTKSIPPTLQTKSSLLSFALNITIIYYHAWYNNLCPAE